VAAGVHLPTQQLCCLVGDYISARFLKVFMINPVFYALPIPDELNLFTS
jgi:hypothetical protein